MKKENKLYSWILLSLIFILIFSLLFGLIYMMSILNFYYQTEIIKLQESKIDFLFQCSSWHEPYYSCQNKTMNITGLYCNQNLVCKNEYILKN